MLDFYRYKKAFIAGGIVLGVITIATGGWLIYRAVRIQSEEGLPEISAEAEAGPAEAVVEEVQPAAEEELTEEELSEIERLRKESGELKGKLLQKECLEGDYIDWEKLLASDSYEAINLAGSYNLCLAVNDNKIERCEVLKSAPRLYENCRSNFLLTNGYFLLLFKNRQCSGAQIDSCKTVISNKDKVERRGPLSLLNPDEEIYDEEKNCPLLCQAVAENDRAVCQKMTENSFLKGMCEGYFMSEQDILEGIKQGCGAIEEEAERALCVKNALYFLSVVKNKESIITENADPSVSTDIAFELMRGRYFGNLYDCGSLFDKVLPLFCEMTEVEEIEEPEEEQPEALEEEQEKEEEIQQ